MKFVRYYNGIRRLGGCHNPDPLRAQVCFGGYFYVHSISRVFCTRYKRPVHVS